jgi:hypothetical protein
VHHDSSAVDNAGVPFRYFFAIINVCSRGLVKRPVRKLTIEVEVDAVEIDTSSQQFRNAVEDASAPYTARHFNKRTEMLSGFELVPTSKVFNKFEKPVETSLFGVRIWRVAQEATVVPPVLDLPA